MFPYVWHPVSSAMSFWGASENFNDWSYIFDVMPIKIPLCLQYGLLPLSTAIIQVFKRTP